MIHACPIKQGISTECWLCQMSLQYSGVCCFHGRLSRWEESVIRVRIWLSVLCVIIIRVLIGNLIMRILAGNPINPSMLLKRNQTIFFDR